MVGRYTTLPPRALQAKALRSGAENPSRLLLGGHRGCYKIVTPRVRRPPRVLQNRHAARAEATAGVIQLLLLASGGALAWRDAIITPYA
eukprot:354821-Pyramimonas_sp.AAC.1